MLNFEEKAEIGYANSPISKLTWIVFFLLLLAVFAFCVQASVYIAMLLISISIAVICFTHAILKIIATITSKPKTDIISNPSVWPFYTVLVPLFRESHMVEQLMQALENIDYPLERIEILMICESIDPTTISEVKQFIRPPFKLIIVPKGVPQTKPRALNYAMLEAKGDLVTIYDAEDIPHPTQLKFAAKAFADDLKLGAIQAPLNYLNADENWLTRQFALEYSALFHVWIPFLVTANLPFPLGGTSNHLRRQALDEIGGRWDSYNVTEDADLSFRLAAKGWNFGYINIPTGEEAVSSWRGWHYQRLRWIKGYMQTWLVHMRKPFAPAGQQGLKRFFILQLTVGLTLLNAMFHLPILLFLIWVMAHQYLQTSSVYVPIIFVVTLGFSYFAGILIAIMGAVRSNQHRLIFSVLAMPLYWLALFPPTVHALWELGTQPFFWHKTDHGVKGRSLPPTM